MRFTLGVEDFFEIELGLILVILGFGSFIWIVGLGVCYFGDFHFCFSFMVLCF
jgi:hypothetical protein